jgi:hypothetical protein
VWSSASATIASALRFVLSATTREAQIAHFADALGHALEIVSAGTQHAVRLPG